MNIKNSKNGKKIMQNIKKQIQTLKDNSELAWASYGYFHLAVSKAIE